MTDSYIGTKGSGRTAGLADPHLVEPALHQGSNAAAALAPSLVGQGDPITLYAFANIEGAGWPSKQPVRVWIVGEVDFNGEQKANSRDLPDQPTTDAEGRFHLYVEFNGDLRDVRKRSEYVELPHWLAECGGITREMHLPPV